MTAENQNINVFSGKFYTIRVQMEPVIDLTGASIEWDVARTPINLSTANGDVLITDATSGIFEMKLLKEHTADLMGEFYHDCSLIDVNGNDSLIFKGKMKVEPTTT